MKKDDVTYLESVLQKQETETLEFKESFEKHEIGKIICSFLNGSGGQLVIGINDKKEIVGIPDAENLSHDIGTFLTNEIIPEPAVSVVFRSYQKKKVIFINVWQGTNQPYIFKGAVYFRIGNISQQASSEQLVELIHGNRLRNERWEAKSAIEIEIGDMDLIEVENCIKDAIASGRESDLPSDPLAFLSKYGLYKNGDFTNSAVLLFAKNPVRFLPQVRVRLSVFKSDKTGENIIYDKIFDKNLFQSINQIIDFFDLAYGVSSSFNTKDWLRKDKSGFPRLAVREAILNAFIHRDYASFSSSLSINIYPNKLQITNFGQLPEGITINDLSNDHLSIPVNPDIAHLFFLRQWIEKIGIGTVKMIAQCKELGFEIPVWSTTNTSVTVTFPNLTVPFNYNEGISEGISEGLNKLLDDYYSGEISEGTSEGTRKGINRETTDKLKDAMLEIIKLLIKHKSLRASDIASKLEKPYKTIERHLKLLKEIKAVEYKGSKRAGGYEITAIFKS
ncbi:MAG: putative DNA binding domain-containing protein [Bacteroidales bacterium]|nr:putative DNA binding domain-containing protein [Bacteroidales bacterium]MCF8458352.1 putative DNA binding domain-containing protein [Bacteroidales bacterium]